MTQDSPSRRLIIVDDDLISREVLVLLSTAVGFEVTAFESGERVLESLENPHAPAPYAILADMQLPGICGDSLGRLLRVGCGPSTTLLAMSGTAVPSTQTQSFDAFLLKPFSIDDLCTVLNRIRAQPAPNTANNKPVLDQSVYDSLAQYMSRAQLLALYNMCFEDAEGRIASIREALAIGDHDLCRSHAHAIKGGSGMVGALELAQLAASVEKHGLTSGSDADPLTEMTAALNRVRRVVDAQEAIVPADK